MPQSDDKGPKQPSLVPGVVLLALAAVLMVVLIVNPDMPSWARRTVALIAVGVVIALLGYAVFVFLQSKKRGVR